MFLEEMLLQDFHLKELLLRIQFARQLNRFDEMVDSIKTILERTPPELSADILETGMYLTGGSASIRNLDKLIAQETDLKVNTVKNPEASVIRGISLIVSDSQYKS